MRKFLFYLSTLCICLAFTACDKDDDNTGGGNNGGSNSEKVIRGEATIDGKDCKIKSVRQLYTPKTYNNFNSIELQFILSDGSFFGLEAYIKDSEKLKEGVYTSSTSHGITDMEIFYADIYVDGEWNEDVDNIKMSVSIKEDIYIIVVEGNYDDGETKEFNFEYEGTMTYITYDVKPNGKGTVVYDDETYELNVGIQEYYGDEYEGVENVDLYLRNYESSIELYFEMFIKSGDKLVAGTYKHSKDNVAMSFSYGTLDLENSRVSAEGAEVEISLSGKTYTIHGKGESYEGKPYTFEYKGELEWFDERELSERNYAPERSKKMSQKKR